MTCKKNYKAIALDLDGTLTNSQKIITEKTKNALMSAQKDGVKVILASGRPTYGIVPLGLDLDMQDFNGYILAFNGGMISQMRNKNGEMKLKTVSENTLPMKVIKPVYDFATKFNLKVVTYEDDKIISEDDNIETAPYVLKESMITKMPVKKVENFVEYVNFPVVKCLISGDPAEIEKAEIELIKIYGDELNIFRSEPFFLEVCPKGIDKAQSLAQLIAELGIKQSELISFGDGFNDVSMVNYAGLGIAMSNAQEACKAVANYVTKSNDEDGIAYALEKFLK